MVKRLNENVGENLYLYHATDKENLDTIFKNGLSINPPKHNWDGMYCDGAIFLAFDASVAEDYVDSQEKPPEEIAVLKVKLSKLDSKYFDYDWNNRCEYVDDINSCIYKKDIPSNLLKLCNVSTEPFQDFSDFENTELYDIVYDVFWEECETNIERDD